MDLMTIGAFAGRSRLSQGAASLRPARVAPAGAHRSRRVAIASTARTQVAGAQRAHAAPLRSAAADPAGMLRSYGLASSRSWRTAEVLVSYIQAKLTGADMAKYDVQTRIIPERTLRFPSAAICTQTRRTPSSAMPSPGCGQAVPAWRASSGCPFLVFYGEVSDDGDGPMELCRPVTPAAPQAGGSDGRRSTPGGASPR